MDSRIIALAIPFFFLLIGVELAVSRAQGVRRYAFHDSIASLGCGIGEQVIVLFTTALAVSAYAFVSSHFGLTRISSGSWLAWVAVLLAVDHQFYWFHRASHRVNALWAAHAVHHQSEEYNLSTALRQSWIEGLLATPFYFPLAVVGFPLAMFATASTVNLLYQFWVHTRLIGRLGRAEGVLNTPSSHRVHHGIDPSYVDKNYGGMFMLWDRMYGTYAAETEEPVYGTVKPLQSWSPLWANLEGWVRLATMSRATSSASDALAVWLAPPDWRPRDLGGPVVVQAVDRAAYSKFDTRTTRGADRYVAVQFALVTAATSALMWFSAALPRPLVAGVAAWILAALAGWGGLFEGRPWSVPLEVVRHAAGGGLALLLVSHGAPAPLAWAAFVSAGGSITFLALIQRRETSRDGVAVPSPIQLRGLSSRKRG